MLHNFFLQNGFISIRCITVKIFMNFEGDLEVVLVKKGKWKTTCYPFMQVNRRVKEEIEDKNGAKEGSLKFSEPKEGTAISFRARFLGA